MNETTKNFSRCTRALATLFCLLLHQSAQAAKTNTNPQPLTLQEAMFAALQNNLSLQLGQMEPLRKRQEEIIAQAVFDPAIRATAARSGGGGRGSYSAGLEAQKLLPAGSTVRLGLDLAVQGGADPATTSTLGLTLPLGQGKGRGINSVRLSQARLSLTASLHEVQGTALALAGDMHAAWLRALLAQKKLAIYESSLALARRQLEQTSFLVEVGKLAGVERVGAEAEVAQRQQDLLVARGEVSRSQLVLARLLSAPGGEGWDAPLVRDQHLPPPPPDEKLVAHLKRVASRPDLAQARLNLKNRDLELVRTADGLLPKLDVFVNLSRRESSGSVVQSLGHVLPLGGDYSVGVNLDWNQGRRAEKATHAVAQFSQRQAKLAITNLERQAAQQVRQAFLDLGVSRDRLASAAATLRLQRARLSAEEGKFKAGTTTNLAVAQAQRDLLASQLSQAEALVNLQLAWGALLLADGSLLKQFGLSVRENQ